MSPEEFDSRLKSSFQDEYLPPKDQLWQNINHRLAQNAKNTFWYWFVPVLIVIVAGIAWLGSGISPKQQNEKASLLETVSKPDNDLSKTTDSYFNTEENVNTSGNINENDHTDKIKNETKNVDKSVSGNERLTNSLPLRLQGTARNSSGNTSSSNNSGNNSEENNGSKTGNNASENTLNINDNDLNGNLGKSTDKTNTPDANARTGSGTNAGFDELIAESFRLSLYSYPYFKHRYSFDKDQLLTFDKPDIPKKGITSRIPKTYRSNYNTDDFDSKWWFEIGMGPQRTLNSIKVKDDSIEYIHKDLWNNRNKLTHNGSGFQAYTAINYKFKKNFILGIGLNYSLRTEDIRINETSYEVAFRDKGRIVVYDSLLIKAIIRYPNGDSAITYYYGVANFALAVKNKYQVFTLPFNLKSEHKLSENTFFSVGIGGGFSMIFAKQSTHLNMVSETEVIKHNTTQFSVSLNASLALYTNFNDIGQVGIYSAFQMYNSPWKVNNGQYAIKMSDIQFGLTFRKPLNWKLGN